MSHKYPFSEPGCLVDGAGGHGHCREMLAALLVAAGISVKTAASYLIPSLRGPMPDDAWDEEEALDVLNQSGLWPPTLTLEFVDGDLVLVEAES